MSVPAVGKGARVAGVLGTLVLATAALHGCREEPEAPGQIIVYVDTDAPVAGLSRDGAAPGVGPTPLVDRVRFDVLRGGVPVPNGTRDFLVSEDQFRAGAVSFGVFPLPDDTSITVRVRLFRDDKARDAEPKPGVSMDTTVRLSAVHPTGVERWTVFLSADDFGRRLGEIEPVAARPGEPGATRVGSWPRATRATCVEPARAEEACIPGGTFFLGDPAFRGRTAGNDITGERLVVLSPFYLDRAEVTAGEFRSAWPDLSRTGVVAPVPWSGGADGAVREDWCTWTADPASAGAPRLDPLPLNCVPWDTARAYCVRLGKDLPTEAQYEYVMSGMGEEWSYPWGDEETRCDWAVWGRAGIGAYASAPADCRPPVGLGGVARRAAGSRDRVEIDGRSVVDLAGNVAEWARDVWSRESEPFWQPLAPMFDPVANVTGSVDGDRRAVRGGRWTGAPLNCRAASRLQNRPTDVPPSIGFRCARTAQRQEPSR